MFSENGYSLKKNRISLQAQQEYCSGERSSECSIGSRYESWNAAINWRCPNGVKLHQRSTL